MELAPTPTPSPAAKTLLHDNSLNQVQRTVDIKQIIAQHMAAVSRLQPRKFTARRASTGPVVHQDVTIAARPGATFAHAANLCAQQSPEIERVRGDVTPGGVLTITGICFGTSGNVRISGQFNGGGFDLRPESWSDAVVKARLVDYYDLSLNAGKTGGFQGSLDQPVELRLATHRTARGMTVVSPNLVSAPVRLNYVAERATVNGTGYVDTVACATGEPLDPRFAEFCGDRYAWASNCQFGTCMVGYHVRKNAANGEDVFSVSLHHGFVLDNVLLLGDNTDLAFDPTIDPSHVTFRIRWRTVHKTDPAMVKLGNAEYADYNDGSYMFYPTFTGPNGARP